jgi:hypothetical protein
MDDGLKAVIGFVGTHCDAFKVLKLTEEVFD